MRILWFKIFLHLTLSTCFELVSENGTVSHDTKSTNFDSEFETVPQPRIDFGILHTLDSFSKWSVKEESISKILAARLDLLRKESKLIRSYLNDYMETSGKALIGLHNGSLNTHAREGGKIIGSSSVLGHRMIDRSTSILAQLQGLLGSSVYTENQRNVSDELDVLIIKTWKEHKWKKKHNPVLTCDGIEERNLAFSNFTKTVKEIFFTNDHNLKEPQPPLWPNDMDKYMSGLSIAHIHANYGFFPRNIRYGLSVHTKYTGFLNARHCAEIGVLALKRQYHYVAIEWLELAKNVLTSPYEIDNTIQLDLISSLVDIAIKEHNVGLNNETKESPWEFYDLPTYEREPVEERIRGRKFFYMQELEDFGANQMSPLVQYWGVCSEALEQTPEEQINLKCFYENKRHPYLYINPIKTELLSETPLVIQFYDLLSNETIEKIKRIAGPRMELSKVVGRHDLDEVIGHRTSVGTFLKFDEVPKLYDHSEIVSGLKLYLASEAAQVAEYTYGRHYTYHTDALGDNLMSEEKNVELKLEEDGDRVATMLYYLELPDHGGKTAFCNAKVNAHPARGSAILWYNLFRNGTIRPDTYHGACPVIHGHKIIINHWVRYIGNWQHYKCTLNQFE